MLVTATETFEKRRKNMSVQFGRWNFDGSSADPDYLKKVAALTAPYGPGGFSSYAANGVTVLYGAFHTTKESHSEVQPYVSESGAVIAWDGRLDNRREIIHHLGGAPPADSNDLLLISTAFERWGRDCFGQLIGDWAVSIWNPADRSLTLAVDFLGTRQLYYSFDDAGLTWCTVMDPLVQLARRRFDLNEEYLAGLFASFPATGLTPFMGIHSVPPAHFVFLRPGTHTSVEYWRFDPSKRFHYRKDSEYEEHFRVVFGQAVRRRIRSDKPVLAELSGGMDSSSIVCMADELIAKGMTDAPRLDTLSYYNDSEPNWDERPYFTRVEEHRGRTGFHIDAALPEEVMLKVEAGPFAATPGALGCRSRAREEFAACLDSQGYRVVLSGIGGDEFLGGVPNPIPELSDLLTQAQLKTLGRQLRSWALAKRQPWPKLLLQSAQPFLPPSLIPVPSGQNPPPWLSPGFVKRHSRAITGSKSRPSLFGPLPSFQDNILTLDQLRRFISSTALPIEPLYEKRYPYLDRDLLEFVYAIPREQLLRPGQRRSLMRRALVGIVPDEILNRRRKAYVTRMPMAAVSAQWSSLSAMTRDMVSVSLGIVDPNRLTKALEEARNGINTPMISLMRVFAIEHWLRHLQDRGALALPAGIRKPGVGKGTADRWHAGPSKASAS